MEPAYPVNTLVIIKETSASEVQLGEPVAFKSDALNGQIAFHRVVEIRDNGFVTKGDNNSGADNGIVLFDQVVGKAVFHTTFTVWLFDVFTSPTKVLGQLVLPLLGLILILVGLRYFLVRANVRRTS